MSNKDTTDLMRKLRRQGAVFERRGSTVLVYGPRGRYILHLSMASGQPMHMTKKLLRRIGFDV